MDLDNQDNASNITLSQTIEAIFSVKSISKVLTSGTTDIINIKDIITNLEEIRTGNNTIKTSLITQDTEYEKYFIQTNDGEITISDITPTGEHDLELKICTQGKIHESPAPTLPGITDTAPSHPLK